MLVLCVLLVLLVLLVLPRLRVRIGRVVLQLLLQALDFPPVIGLPLIAIVDHECQRAREGDDDEALDDALVNVIVVFVGTTGRYGIGEILFVRGMVVGVRLFEEIGYPLAKRKIGFRL